MGLGFWPSLKQGVNAGVLLGGYAYAGNVYFVGSNAPVFGKRVDTIAQALALMVPKDILFLGPQRHEEGNLVLPATLNNVTIIGAGNRGACFIEPSVAASEGLQVLADDVTLINVGVAGKSTADYALNIKGARRFRAYGCKIEGPDGTALLLNGSTVRNVSDLLFEDCEFCWCGSCIVFQESATGFGTQIQVLKSRFHNFVVTGLGVITTSLVKNLEFYNNQLEQLEDGTEPTDFILLSDNGNTGHIAGNQFAIATNATAKLTIGTGLMWGPNGTEAGWSTARPA